MDELKIAYHESAFRHGIGKADIEWAIKTYIFERPFVEEKDTYFIVGYDCSANLLEAAFRELDDGTLYVFHAMPARKQSRIAAGMEKPWEE